jgi:hypothetical protein
MRTAEKKTFSEEVELVQWMRSIRWFEGLTANANVAIALVSISILRYSGILETADEAVLNLVHKNEYDQSEHTED